MRTIREKGYSKYLWKEPSAMRRQAYHDAYRETRGEQASDFNRRRIDNLKRTLKSMGIQRSNDRRRRRFQGKPRMSSGTDRSTMRRVDSNAAGHGSGRATELDDSLPPLRSRDVTQRSLVLPRDEADRLPEGKTSSSFASARNPSGQVTPRDLQFSDRLGKKAKHRRKPRQGFLRTFAKLGKFVCILIGLWKKHADKVKEFLENVDLVSVEEISDLLFDKTDYSADKRARISTYTKRVLSMPQQLRTEKDIRYVEIALRNYPSIAAYPVSIQNLIARKAWYELYAGRRIIIKQGHVARCFYFILSGKVVISKQEEDSLVSRTLCYLNKGDSFGERALINKCVRSATVISEGTVELLVVTDEDYEEIFTSGELTEKYFPFLKAIGCFHDWPLELLINNLKKASIAYSKRKTVICENTSTTPWLYVIKSGSVTVLKKLKEPRKVPHDTEENERTSKLQNLSAEGHYLHLCSIIQKESRLTRRQTLIRYHKLKELGLGISTNLANVVTSATTRGHTMDAINEVSAANNNSPPKLQPVISAVDVAAKRKQMTTWQMGPLVTRTGLSAASVNEDGTLSIADSDNASFSVTPQFNNSRRVSFDLPEQDPVKKEDPECFVTVQTLVKGDVFGLAELIHGRQPTFILVSNGAECIMIDKRLYWEKATDCQKIIRRLKDEVLSYPTDEKMQADLAVAINWERYKLGALNRALGKAQTMKKLRSLPAIGLSVAT